MRRGVRSPLLKEALRGEYLLPTPLTCRREDNDDDDDDDDYNDDDDDDDNDVHSKS